MLSPQPQTGLFRLVGGRGLIWYKVVGGVEVVNGDGEEEDENEEGGHVRKRGVNTAQRQGPCW